MKTSSSISRRQFLSRSATAASATIALPYFVPRSAFGANDRVSIAHIGTGGRGTSLLGGTLKNTDCEVVAVCDVDKERMARAAAAVDKTLPANSTKKTTQHQDFRRVLDDKSVDAVVIASPDHWHALSTVLACQAGKDVYCEKPACNTIREGQAMVEAGKKYKRVIQIGSTGRSQKDSISACEYIRNDQLGKVSRVTCWHPPSPEGGDITKNGPPPPHIDWDLWLGPAAFREYNPDIHPAKFRWLLDLGGGQIRDRGAHIFSLALWFMNADHQSPVSVDAMGAAPRKGFWNCPTLMNVTYRFENPDWTLIWQQPGSIPEGRRKDYGARYWGEKDSLWLEGGDGGCVTEQKARDFKVPAGGVEVYHSPGHFEDFVKCLKTREKPIMNIEAGVAVANLCIMGNLSYILKRRLQWDGKQFVGDDEANALLSRPGRGQWRIPDVV